MARSILLVDAGGLIAIADARDRLHRLALAVLAEFLGDLVTTWPAVREACHIVPAHLEVALVEKLAQPRWRVLRMEGPVPRLAELLRKSAERAEFEIYRTKAGRRLEVLP